jgi:hypothetical protein
LWDLEVAYDINNRGQITGWGFFNGATRAFLLNPIKPIPEPSTWAMMMLGFATVGSAARTRRRVDVHYGF